MQQQLVNEIVALCRRRLEQGDHPTERPASVEMLENTVIFLAAQWAEREPMPEWGEAALRAMLSRSHEPEQAEPVAQVVSSVCDEDEAHIRWLGEPLPVGMLLYAAAPQQTPQER